MRNEHCEYVRIAKNKDRAVLMVHGIVGSPRYFDRIMELFDESWSVYNILLEGHGGTVEDFCNASMEKWKNQVGSMVDYMCSEYKEVVVVAHSMGTLLTIDKAKEKNSRIKKMILFAVPLTPRIKPVALMYALKIIFKKVNDENVLETNAREQYSIEPDGRLWRYIGFAPRYIELLKLAHDTRAVIDKIKSECCVFMCAKDEMVSKKACEYLIKNDNIKIHMLKNSTHNYFSKKDLEEIKKEIKMVIDKKG